jgi:hypothetical protein
MLRFLSSSARLSTQAGALVVYASKQAFGGGAAVSLQQQQQPQQQQQAGAMEVEPQEQPSTSALKAQEQGKWTDDDRRFMQLAFVQVCRGWGWSRARRCRRRRLASPRCFARGRGKSASLHLI